MNPIVILRPEPGRHVESGAGLGWMLMPPLFETQPRTWDAPARYV
jgi:hypothetical protein